MVADAAADRADAVLKGVYGFFNLLFAAAPCLPVRICNVPISGIPFRRAGVVFGIDFTVGRAALLTDCSLVAGSGSSGMAVLRALVSHRKRNRLGR